MPSFREAFRRGAPGGGRGPDHPPLPAGGPEAEPRLTFPQWIEQRIRRAFDNPGPDSAINAERLAILAKIRDAAAPEERRQAAERAKELGDLTEEELAAVTEGRVPTMERPFAERVLEMAYRLKTGKFDGRLEDFQRTSQQNALENPPPSEELENATGWWMGARELLLKAYTDKEHFTRDVARLQKEIKEPERRGEMGSIAAKESELQALENKLTTLGIEEKEAQLKKIQEQLKAQLIDEFRKDKGAFIRANKDAFVAQFGEEFKRTHGMAADYDLTPADVERLVKWQLSREVKTRSTKVIADTIFTFDDELGNERRRRAAEFQERGNIQKFLEWQRSIPTWKRIAVSGLIAGGVASGLAMWGGATLLGAVAVAGTYRVLRTAVGGLAGMGAALGINKVADWIYGKRKAELRKERVVGLSQAIEDEVGAADDWLENEASRLRVAEIIDAFVDEQRELAEKLRQDEAKKRKWLGILYGVLGGLAGGLALDAVTGGKLPSIADLWEKKKAVPAAAGVAGAPPVPGGPRVPGYDSAWADYGALDAAQATEPQYGSEWADYGTDTTPSARAGATPDTTQGSGAGRGAGAGAVAGAAEAVSGTSVKAEAMLGGRGVWGGVEEILKENAKTNPALAEILGNKAKATYLIDSIKDKVVANPGQYLSGPGRIVDIDRLPGGTKLNIADILGDQKFKGMIAEAGGLSEQLQEQIIKNNAQIAKWVADNPGKPLTGAQVEEILRGKTGAGGGVVSAAAEAAGSGPGKPGISGVAPDTSRNFTLLPNDQGPDLSLPEDIKLKTEWPQDLPTSDRKGSVGGSEVAEGAKDQGGGRVISLEPQSPEAPAPEAIATTPFGSVLEQAVGTKAGFTPEQWGFTKGFTVDKLLKEIPEGKWSAERAEMWSKFGANNPPDLYPRSETYLETILRKQAALADAIYDSKPNEVARNMTIEQFVNQFGDKLNIKKPWFLWK